MSENRIRRTAYKQPESAAGAGVRVDPTSNLLIVNANGTERTQVDTDSVQTLTNKILVATGLANPSAAQNVISVIQAAANTYTGSVAGVRSTVTVSATAAIGNAYSGRFELIQSALPASQGHTAALVAQVSATGAGNSPTSVLTLTLNSAANAGVVTPFIYFQEATANKTTLFFKADTLGTAGSGSSAVCFGTGAVIAAGDITAGLRVSINGAIYHIPLVATAAWNGS